MTEIEPPSLYEIKKMGDDAGLVGEDDTHLVVFVSCIYGGFVWMRGPSRAGKDEVVDAVEFCLPDGDGFGLFNVPSSSSPTALFKKKTVMNNRSIHRYPDLASLPEHLEVILKSHGEGESVSHEFATGTDAGDLESQTLYPPDAFILFHASDNEKIDPDDYPELRNRALMVSVDASEDLTTEINTEQARREAGLYTEKVPDDRKKEIREYITTIPKDEFTDGVGEILNPVAVAIDNQNPLPQKFVEARMDFPRLLRFMKSVTMFHHADRMKYPTDSGRMVMPVTPADAWLTMRVFGQEMILSSLNLRDRDLAILRFLREDMSQAYSKSELQQKLRSAGLNVTDRDVATSLKGMKNKGYVRKDDSQSPILWSATPFASQVDAGINLDWSEMVEDTVDVAYKTFDDSIADEYVERFCEKGGLEVRDPLNGDVVDITEASVLKEEVEDRIEVEEEIIEEETVEASEGGSDEPDPSECEPEGQADLGGVV
jgi:hypothetical protein